MKWLFLSSVLLLSGCSTIDSPLFNYKLVEDQNFTASEGSDQIRLRWIRLPMERLQPVCAMTTGLSSKNIFLGCAGIDANKICTVYTAINTTHQIFGHEVRHCFHGNFHK